MVNSSETTATEGRRLGFAGFVCWPRPEPVPAGRRKQFLSISESVQKALQSAGGPAGTSTQKWKFIRYSTEGRRFIGFVCSR